jgi:hypothetical protein
MRPLQQSLVCERVREQISVGLDGELSQLEHAMVEFHLRRCAECRAYGDDVTGFTGALRSAPLEPPGRAIAIQRPRRAIRPRAQVVVAAAILVAALLGAGRGLDRDTLQQKPNFVPQTPVKLPSPQQLEREQAILERARPGHVVDIRSHVL